MITLMLETRALDADFFAFMHRMVNELDGLDPMFDEGKLEEHLGYLSDVCADYAEEYHYAEYALVRIFFNLFKRALFNLEIGRPMPQAAELALKYAEILQEFARVECTKPSPVECTQ
jgi:hypothetical protein